MSKSKHNQSRLTSSVDSFHGFKEKESKLTKRNKQNAQNAANNINPSHQYMEVIRAANANRTFLSEDFPAPIKNKFVYSRENILNLWKPQPSPVDVSFLPEVIVEKSLIPLCKDDGLMKEYNDALHGYGKWASLQSPARTSRPRGGRGRKGSRGRPDSYISSDSRKPKDDKKSSKSAWGNGTTDCLKTPSSKPPPISLTQQDSNSKNTKSIPDPQNSQIKSDNSNKKNKDNKLQTKSNDSNNVQNIKQDKKEISNKKEEPKTIINQNEIKKEEKQEEKWEYLNDYGNIEGPYLSSTMKKWYDKDYLPSSLKIRKVGEKDFSILSNIISSGKPNIFVTSNDTQKDSQITPNSNSTNNTANANIPVNDTNISIENLNNSTPNISNNSNTQVQATKNPNTNNSVLNFATLLGITPDQIVQSRQESTPFPNFNFNESNPSSNPPNDWSSKVWSVDQIEGQRRNIQQQNIPKNQTTQQQSSSVWGNPSNSNKFSLKEIQEQQLKQNPNNSSLRNATDSFDSNVNIPPSSSTTSDWNPEQIFSQSNQEQNFSNVGWGNSSFSAPSLLQIQQEEKLRNEKQNIISHPIHPTHSPMGWNTINNSNQSSLLTIQQEEEKKRMIEQRKLYEEQMRNNNNKPSSFTWNSTPNEPLSLQEIQKMQLEEERRQAQEHARKQQQMMQTQNTSLHWSSPTRTPMSLREIQEEELRQKQMQEQQIPSSNASVNLTWGSTWGVQPTSLTQIQHQQAQTTSNVDVWGNPSSDIRKPISNSTWDEDDESRLLWESVPTKEPSEFPSLQSISPKTSKQEKKKQTNIKNKSQQKTNISQTPSSSIQQQNQNISKTKQQSSSEINKTNQNKKQTSNKKQQQKNGRKKKNRRKKVDASEFFSFTPGSLAGRPIEQPEY